MSDVIREKLMFVMMRYMRRRLPLIIAAIVGLACLTFLGFWLVDYLRVTTEGPTSPTNETLSRSVDQPSEKPVTVNDDYLVPDDQPRVIEIPSINAKGYVQRVGVDADKVMVSPNNIAFTGWYVGSVAPGEKGVSIINGHAGGRYVDGIFKQLNRLTQGDEFRIQMGDASWRTFEVVSVKAFSVAEAQAPLYHDDPAIENELHLITCDGAFDDRTQTYDQRLIVVAKRINQ